MSSPPLNKQTNQLLALGALRFVHDNLYLAVTRNLWRHIDFTHDNWINPFLADIPPLTFQQLLNLGDKARRVRCNENWALRTIQVKTAKKVEIFWPWSNGDHSVDGTAYYGNRDEDRRMYRGPTWNNNCCALTVAFMCALWSNLGRKLCDQLPQQFINRMSMPQRALRYILMFNLSRYFIEKLDCLRDALIEELSTHDPVQWGCLANGEFAPVLPLIEFFYEGSPQMSYTYIMAYVCCDGKWEFRPQEKVQQSIGLYRNQSYPTLEDGVNKFFRGRKSTREDHCSTGTGCTLERWKRPLVLDRPPPSLVVRCPGLKVGAAKAAKAFENLKVTYHTSNGQAAASYRPYLAVYLSEGHFTVRGYWDGRFWEHNGYNNGNTFQVRGWTQKKEGAELIMIQYEQYTEAESVEVD